MTTKLTLRALSDEVWFCSNTSVCLSVRHALWYCVKTAKHIAECLSSPDSRIILVFSPLIAVTKFGRGHPNWAPKRQIQDSYENARFTASKSLFLGNGESDSYNGRLSKIIYPLIYRTTWSSMTLRGDLSKSLRLF